MTSKIKNNFRHNNYDTGDVGVMFLIALVLPQFMILAVMLICTSVTGLPFSSAEEGAQTFVEVYPMAYTIIASLVPQISMLAGFIFVTERKKVSYIKGNQIFFKKFNPLILLVVLAIGVICLFGFSPFVNWFDHLVESWGYTSSVANIDVSSVGKFIASIFFIGLAPAICEELVFRGVITNGLKSKGVKVAVVLSALLFAIMHQNLQQFVYQLFLGGVMAYIVLKTGNILYTMFLHFFNNFVVLLNTHLNPNATSNIDYTNAWNNIWPFLLVILTIAMVVGLLVLLNYIVKKQKTLNTQNDVEDSGITKNENQNSTLNKQTGFRDVLKNPFMIVAIVSGVVFWIFSIVTGFLS